MAEHETAAGAGRGRSAAELYETKWYRWYVLAILTGVYTFNFIDRQILNILQVPIKEEMGLSNTQLGLLTGDHDPVGPVHRTRPHG